MKVIPRTSSYRCNCMLYKVQVMNGNDIICPKNKEDSDINKVVELQYRITIFSLIIMIIIIIILCIVSTSF